MRSDNTIGFDAKHLQLTGRVAMTMCAGRADTHNIPCIITALTEKRFFEWHEDDTAVTIRNKSGSYGGGQRCL